MSEAESRPLEPRLERELVQAGRSLVLGPVPDDLSEQVLRAIATQPVRRSWRTWLRARRRRLVAAVIAAVLLALLLTPPVRAAVVEWLRIGGVLIRSGPAPSTESSVGPTARGTTLPGQTYPLEQARALVGFPVGVPALLGAPARVTVSADRRVVGMDWVVDGEPIHLDQFDGTMSWAFLKRNAGSITVTTVDDRDAVWVADAHELVYVDRDGVERPETARQSGPCLVWEPMLDASRTTARLEGFTRLDRAVAVAESLGS